MFNYLEFNFIAMIVSSFFAVMFIVLGLPLFLGIVKRNYFYGYRISHYAMLDDDIWLAANHQGGRYLIIMGILLAINAFFAFLFVGHTTVQSIILHTDALIVIVGFIYSIVRGKYLNEKLAEAKGLKSQSPPPPSSKAPNQTI